MGSIKVIVIGRVLATAMVRSDVDSVSRNRYGAGEIDLLPATGGLVAKGGPGKPRTRGSPQVTHVCTGVQRPFVEADRGDMARNGTLELDTLLDRVGIVPVRRTRRIVSAEQAKRSRARCRCWCWRRCGCWCWCRCWCRCWCWCWC